MLNCSVAVITKFINWIKPVSGICEIISKMSHFPSSFRDRLRASKISSRMFDDVLVIWLGDFLAEGCGGSLGRSSNNSGQFGKVALYNSFVTLYISGYPNLPRK